MRIALALSLCLLAGSGAFRPIVAQEQGPELYDAARDALINGDTLIAITRLRELTEARPDFAPGWGLLGRILATRASGVATDFRDRVEAEKALRQALKLDSDHPLYLLALAEVMRKQQMILDSRRVLNQAIQAMEENPDELPPSEEAELWYQRALWLEDAYLDTRHFTWVPDLPVTSPDCSTIGTFCLNFSRPRRFNQYFRHAEDMSSFGEDDFEKMAETFRKALEADSTHPGSFRRLAIHLVDRGEYEEAEELALSYRDHAPESPWGYMVLGLVHYRTGKDSLAEAEFALGLERAPHSFARHYRDVSPLLREGQAGEYGALNEQARRRLEDVLWRKSDPLYLSAGNEVRVAHMARMTYADLMFEDPAEGRWGSETEMGLIYVRYGPPERIWQVQRDVSREFSTGAAANNLTGTAKGGGRWIFWNYGWELPNFIFQKQLRFRHTTHIISSYSKALEEDAREAQPAVYSVPFTLVDYPVQVARFRGATDSIVEVDFYSEIPGDTLLDQPGEMEVGIFVFTGADFVEVYRRELNVSSDAKRQALTYSLPLPGATYTVSLEARADSTMAAVRRETVEAKPFRDGQLAMSDIVLARTVTPKVEEPVNRHDFAFRVNRTRIYEPTDPLAIYWEVYGLSTDDEGFSRYRVKLNVKDAGGTNVFARVIGALGNLFGGDADEQQIELTYEREVDVRENRVPEYLSLDLVDDEPGEYRVRIEVTDLATAETTVAERTFHVVAPPGEGEE